MQPAPQRTYLTGARRDADVAALADGRALDVLVIGGGVTGAGIALDAASRGLSTALVERGDLASGTSRWSSKLVHGGLRYLARGEVGLAYESARERAILLQRTAPHLVRPLPFVLPLTEAVGRADRAGLRLLRVAAETLRAAAGTRASALPRGTRLTAEATLRLVPSLRAEGLAGSFVSYDGLLEDDARLVVTIARTAAAHGARIVTSCRALRADGHSARLRDERRGAEFDVRAKAVVNATGVWADRLDPEVSLRPSKGAHLVVRAPGLAGLSAALTVPVPGERNRFLLVIPREADTVHLGLTDDPLDGPLSDDSDVPHADADDAAFLLDTVSTALATPLTPADVVGSFAGLRPLAAGADPATRTADLSRRHVVARSSTGLLSVFGGKLTTYRRMAQDAVDALGLPAAACRTARLPLVGAASREALARVAAPARLVARFGADAPAVAALADDDPRLLEPVVPGLPVLGVELVFGVVAEGAMSVEDLLERRTRLGFFPAQVHEAVPAAEQALKRWLTPRAD